ncbi:MAG: Pr2TM family membrane protein [Gammaproteobacteria bacterium]|nr:Pr2TM family membrane protein [Gammaproteobacteria bacterium]
MIVRKLRLQRGWSQEQLAQMSGLSIRTVQRIERGEQASLESMKSLAAVFEIDFSNLTQEIEMQPTETITSEEQMALEYVRELKGFYSHLAAYVLTIALLFIINYLTSPGYIWAVWPAFGWGIGIALHGISMFKEFNLFGADWEKRQVEKRLGRKL